MDTKFSYFYPVKVEQQLDFEGKVHNKDVFLTGHIVYNGRLMCKESREVIVNRTKADKEKNSPTRLPRVSICPACQQEYKDCPDSQYYQWTHALPTQTVGIEILSKDVVTNEAQA
jgi:hypothetical protein